MLETSHCIHTVTITSAARLGDVRMSMYCPNVIPRDSSLWRDAYGKEYVIQVDLVVVFDNWSLDDR